MGDISGNLYVKIFKYVDGVKVKKNHWDNKGKVEG